MTWRDTIDYAALHELVAAIVDRPRFDLIEALAGAIARAVLAATDPALVDAVEVRVRKPDAPIDGALRHGRGGAVQAPPRLRQVAISRSAGSSPRVTSTSLRRVVAQDAEGDRVAGRVREDQHRQVGAGGRSAHRRSR